MKDVSIVLVGAGGYGAGYVQAILDHGEESGAVLVAVVDPFVESSPHYERLVEKKIPLFKTLEAFYEGNAADMAVISTPIQFHASQTVYCMEHGSNVLCEKPAAATPALVDEMIAARERTGRKLAIGFQWCYDEAMLHLKADADAGLFGKPVRLKGIVLWPRDIGYYKRGQGWAGKKYAANGEPIFDSVASNATAHYVENMLWLAGKGFEGVGVAKMNARALRANDIEMFDTVVMDCVLENGAQMFYVASHAVGADGNQNPTFVYEFEKATMRFGELGENGRGIVATFKDGTVKEYGSSAINGWQRKVEAMVACTRGEDVVMPCPAEAARRHTRAMEMVNECCPEAEVFTDIRVDNNLVWVPGLKDKLIACYENWDITALN